MEACIAAFDCPLTLNKASPGEQVTDGTCFALARLPFLTALDLRNHSEIGVPGLKALGALPLRSLRLANCCALCDAGLAVVGGMTGVPLHLSLARSRLGCLRLDLRGGGKKGTSLALMHICSHIEPLASPLDALQQNGLVSGEGR